MVCDFLVVKTEKETQRRERTSINKTIQSSSEKELNTKTVVHISKLIAQRVKHVLSDNLLFRQSIIAPSAHTWENLLLD